MSGTAARHRALRSLLSSKSVSSQGDLVDLLQQEGFDVTQATVSRDLQAVGAVKTRDTSGGFRYALADDLGSNSEAELAIARVLGEFAITIQASGNLVVVRTPPGAAHVVAAAVDSGAIDGVLGTVAGDDTLMIVATEDAGGAAVAKELERIGAGT